MKTLDRRRFAQLGAWGLGLAAAAKSGIALATGAAPRRRHLINIHGHGGWDSAWHHSPLLEAETAGLGDLDRQRAFFGTPNAARFADDAAIPFAGGFLGPGMAAYNAQDLQSLFIWRGLSKEGDHEVGNKLLMNGHLSGYASSFSTLVADGVAKTDYLRPLHYVQIAPNPGALFTQVGLLHGPGVPVSVPDLTTWRYLTAPATGDTAGGPALQAILADAVGTRLAGMTGGLQLASSRARMAEEFTQAFGAARSLRGSNAGDSAEFNDTLARYKTALKSDLNRVVYSGKGGEAVRACLATNAALNPAAGIDALFTAAYGNDAAVTALVFPFALAEYLVVKDLSAVVDVYFEFADLHNNNEVDLVHGIAARALMRALTGALRDTALPGSGGAATFLDATMVVMSTEFDRELARTPLTPATTAHPGTSHGSTVSVLMAGHGVNGGRIAGARMTGPNGALGALGRPFAQAVPIDPATGVPSATGALFGPRALLPTVLAIFEIPVPAQQVTDARPLPAAIGTRKV